MNNLIYAVPFYSPIHPLNPANPASPLWAGRHSGAYFTSPFADLWNIGFATLIFCVPFLIFELVRFIKKRKGYEPTVLGGVTGFIFAMILSIMIVLWIAHLISPNNTAQVELPVTDTITVIVD